MSSAKYSRHYRDHAEGHVFIDKPGACTVQLTGAASMAQSELDGYGELLARAITARKIETFGEVDALPVGAVVLAQFPAGAMEKFSANQWGAAGSHVMYPPGRVPLPALLLWNPETDQRP
ncbi:hypothetical protein FHT44_005076 [Mycolicibacterium sp. BK634]|uniref:hypothetical protein n=1 Tax=Mycolicibacterium sp. BK634 TaxID=2587099 RepID=UPI00160F5B03|nr:hypothetical protein [Mycolicibacterium sp. BK634]MBB3752564.1 hypothetical protein [Mycolicibacterium sp. BK634]